MYKIQTSSSLNLVQEKTKFHYFKKKIIIRLSIQILRHIIIDKYTDWMTNRQFINLEIIFTGYSQKGYFIKFLLLYTIHFPQIPLLHCYLSINLLSSSVEALRGSRWPNKCLCFSSTCICQSFYLFLQVLSTH